MKVYRRVLMSILVFSLIFLAVYAYMLVQNAIPDEIKIVVDEKQQLNFKLPVDADIYKESVEASAAGVSNIPSGKIKLNLNAPCTIYSNSTGSYQMECRLFGLIRLKNVKVHVVEEKKLIPCGIPIGIYMNTDGILVIGTGNVRAEDGMSYEPAYNLIQTGDYILAVNGESIENKKELIDKINFYGEKFHGKEELVFDIRRNGEIIQLKIPAVKTSPDEYKIGVWVRDNTQGIGTLTFMDEQGSFGALGHGINDVDTSMLMEMGDGTLYGTKIISVVKGKRGEPGELTGVIDYRNENILGSITKNTAEGIFGRGNLNLNQRVPGEALELYMKQDIKKGEAQIRCCINGIVKDYEVQILDVNMNGNSVNKGIVLKVTDPELLNLTGGIVQGMSGSPIIQNGHLIGAVTHVFVQDSTKGYGIFIENMLRQVD